MQNLDGGSGTLRGLQGAGGRGIRYILIAIPKRSRLLSPRVASTAPLGTSNLSGVEECCTKACARASPMSVLAAESRNLGSQEDKTLSRSEAPATLHWG